jgi:hypothetical protein
MLHATIRLTVLVAILAGVWGCGGPQATVPKETIGKPADTKPAPAGVAE